MNKTQKITFVHVYLGNTDLQIEKNKIITQQFQSVIFNGIYMKSVATLYCIFIYILFHSEK